MSNLQDNPVNLKGSKIRRISIGFLVLVLSLTIISTFNQSYASPNHSENITAKATNSPHLFFTAERLAALKERIATDPKAKEAWESMVQKADRLLDAKLVSLDYAEGGTGQHGNYGAPSGQISGMGSTLGLVYQMTKDERYASKLRDAMLYYAKLHRWAGDANQIPPWHSELNTARFCFGYGIGYDSIHDTLSVEDQKTIVNAMVRLGIRPTLDDWILPETRIHALDSMGHNWWSVCVAMAGVASLAIVDDEPQALSWVEQVRDAFPEWFLYQGNILQNKSLNFDRKGAFYESVNYANYALSEFLLFRLAYLNCFPAETMPTIPILDKTGSFFIQTAYPAADSLFSVNFGDSSLHASGARTIQYLRANGITTPGDDWYLSQTDWGFSDPVALVYQHYEPTQEPPSYLPNYMLYPDIGWAMMRSSWDTNATLLAIKSGFAWNHAHPDAGSFILFQGGKPLIIDSGNCSYSRPEYTQYYRQSKAHNVVLTDGVAGNPEACGGQDRGVVTPGVVKHLMDLGGIRYVLADATGPTSWKFSRNYRHFLWIDDAILILDDIRTHEEGQLEWLLHYEGQAKEQNSEIWLSNGEDSRAVVRPLYPLDQSILHKTGLKDHDPDTKVDYLAFAPNEKSREMKFITAVLPLSNSENTPSVQTELIQAENILGVKLTSKDTITEVFFNLQADGRRMHRDSNAIVHGWDTDAAVFGFTRAKGSPDSPQSIQRAFVACGSYLRKGDTVVLDSLSKVYSVFSYKDGSLDAILQGQPLIRCAVWCDQKPEKVRLNGKITEIPWNSRQQVVRLRCEGDCFDEN